MCALDLCSRDMLHLGPLTQYDVVKTEYYNKS